MSEHKTVASLKRVVIDLKSAFEEKRGHPPTKCHLTSSDETLLMAASADDVGDKVSDIFQHGVRAAFPTFFGLTVVWGAEETTVS